MNSLLARSLSAAVLLGGLSLPAISRADAITVTLTPSTETATPGGTVTYSGTLSAPASNGAPIYINGGEVNFSSPPDATNDPGDLLGFLDPLTPGGSSVSGDLFTITTTTADAPGIYNGVLSILGGTDFTSNNTIAAVPFSLDIAAPVSATPEPSSCLLLATGFLAAAAGIRRRGSVRTTR